MVEELPKLLNDIERAAKNALPVIITEQLEKNLLQF